MKRKSIIWIKQLSELDRKLQELEDLITDTRNEAWSLFWNLTEEKDSKGGKKDFI